MSEGKNVSLFDFLDDKAKEKQKFSLTCPNLANASAITHAVTPLPQVAVMAISPFLLCSSASQNRPFSRSVSVSDRSEKCSVLVAGHRNFQFDHVPHNAHLCFSSKYHPGAKNCNAY